MLLLERNVESVEGEAVADVEGHVIHPNLISRTLLIILQISILPQQILEFGSNFQFARLTDL